MSQIADITDIRFKRLAEELDQDGATPFSSTVPTPGGSILANPFAGKLLQPFELRRAAQTGPSSDRYLLGPSRCGGAPITMNSTPLESLGPLQLQPSQRLVVRVVTLWHRSTAIYGEQGIGEDAPHSCRHDYKNGAFTIQSAEMRIAAADEDLLSETTPTGLGTSLCNTADGGIPGGSSQETEDFLIASLDDAGDVDENPARGRAIDACGAFIMALVFL